MGKSTTTSGNFLKLVLNTTTWANIADNASSSPLTTLYVALHTADPGAGGLQSTSETSYTSYIRVAVARNAGGWGVTGAVASPIGAITFAACTGLTATITHASVGVASAGATAILWSGPVTPNIPVSSGVTPQLTTASTITES